MIARSACFGCRNDYYNQPGNALDGKRCWSAKDGKMVTKYAIGAWTQPDQPGAFTKVRVPSCYNRQGTAYYSPLPPFVALKDVVNGSRKSSGGDAK